MSAQAATMRRRLPFLLVVLALVMAGCGGGGDGGGGYTDTDDGGASDGNAAVVDSSDDNASDDGGDETAVVDIRDFAFSPRTIRIAPGESVTWVNADVTAHTATAEDDAWDTGHLPQDANVTLTFDAPGTYAYICRYHPDMRGVVQVGEGDGGDGGDGDGGDDGSEPEGNASEPGGEGEDGETPDTLDVQIQSYRYEPQELRVPAGTTIRWTNLDGDRHTVTETQGRFDSGDMSRNAAWERAFTEPGTYRYYCDRHDWMQATVIVEAA